MTFASRHCFSQLSGITVLALVAMGCARDQEPPQTGYVQGGVQYGGGAGQPGYAAGGYPAGGSTGYGVAGAGVLAGAGGVAALPAGGAASVPPPGTGGATVQQIDPAAASIVQPVLNELAKSHTVAGSKPLGSPIVGNFGTGQSLESAIQLQPQKCYSVVATSLPPVTELNVQLVAATPLPNLAPVLATDSDTGPTAVVGKKPNCYKWALPFPAAAKVVVQVAGGTGLAAAQVYEK